jgi:5'-methylthioadenosine phosphorylase
VTDILAVLEANADLARRAVALVAQRIADARRDCECGRALEHAMITSPDAIPTATRKRLALLLDRPRTK